MIKRKWSYCLWLQEFGKSVYFLKVVFFLLEEFGKSPFLFWKITEIAKVLNSVAHLGPEVWHPPPIDHFKINWDASLDLRRNCIGIGLVVRDSRAECIGAKCSCLFVEGDSRITESLAALHAVFFSKSLELRDVIF